MAYADCGLSDVVTNVFLESHFYLSVGLAYIREVPCVAFQSVNATTCVRIVVMGSVM